MGSTSVQVITGKPSLISKAKAMAYLKKALMSSVPVQALSKALEAFSHSQATQPTQASSPFDAAMSGVAEDKARLERAMNGDFSGM